MRGVEVFIVLEMLLSHVRRLLVRCSQMIITYLILKRLEDDKVGSGSLRKDADTHELFDALVGELYGS